MTEAAKRAARRICNVEHGMAHTSEQVAAIIDGERDARDEKAMRALESLTPNGSEFVDDIDACVAYIRDDRQRDWERIKRLTAKNRQLDTYAKSLKAVLRVARAVIDRNRGLTLCQGTEWISLLLRMDAAIERAEKGEIA